MWPHPDTEALSCPTNVIPRYKVPEVTVPDLLAYDLSFQGFSPRFLIEHSAINILPHRKMAKYLI